MVTAEHQAKVSGPCQRRGNTRSPDCPEARTKSTEMAGFENRDREQIVRVKEGGCAVQHFGLWAINSVGGFVYDRKGTPIPDLKVFLRRDGTREKFGNQATTNIQGAFRFTEIDPGGYAVVISLQAKLPTLPTQDLKHRAKSKSDQPR